MPTTKEPIVSLAEQLHQLANKKQAKNVEMMANQIVVLATAHARETADKGGYTCSFYDERLGEVSVAKVSKVPIFFYYLMSQGRIKFLTRLAGRIRVEEYNAQVYDILNKVQAFMDTKKHHNLSGHQEFSLGSINFNIGQRSLPLQVVAINDQNTNIVAGIDWPKVKGIDAKLVINLSSFRYDWHVVEKLKPYIVHELTHFLDLSQQPVAAQVMDPGEENSSFWKEYLGVLSAISPTNRLEVSSLPSEEVAKRSVAKVVRSNPFKELLNKYNLQLDSVLYGKILKYTIDTIKEDTSFFRDTGGDLFGMNQKDEEVKKTKEVAYKQYFRSDLEVKGYINQIIDEVNTYLMKGGHDLLMGIIQGKVSLSKQLDELLSHSPTFQDMKDAWTPDILKKLYRELANYISQKFTKLSIQDKAKKWGIKVSPQEELVYKYLNNLLDDDSEKLMALLGKEEFVKKYPGAIALFKKQLDFESKISQLRSQMQEVMSA